MRENMLSLQKKSVEKQRLWLQTLDRFRCDITYFQINFLTDVCMLLSFTYYFCRTSSDSALHTSAMVGQAEHFPGTGSVPHKRGKNSEFMVILTWISTYLHESPRVLVPVIIQYLKAMFLFTHAELSVLVLMNRP